MVLDKGLIPYTPSMVTDGGSAHLRAVALFGLAAPDDGKFLDGASGDGLMVLSSQSHHKHHHDLFKPKGESLSPFGHPP